MTTRRILAALSAAGVAGLILLASPAAHAAELELADPARDNDGPGLDIVGAGLDNNDYRLTSRPRLPRQPFGHHDRRAQSAQSRTCAGGQQPPRRWWRQDLPHRAHTTSCTAVGLRADWDADDAELTVSVPSSCLWRGNYGAVQPWVLTEPTRFWARR